MFHKSQIDLSQEIRKESTTLLQRSLASMLDLSLQVKQAHWNCKGLNFIAFHKFLDELHDAVCDFADTIAERITALGADAVGTSGRIQKESILSDYPENIYKIEDHLKALIQALSQLGAEVRKCIDLTADKGDSGTSDLFTEVSRGLDHNLWLLEAHIQA